MVCQTKPQIDSKVAQTAVDFFENLVQLEGQWAGQKLKLSPWQDKVIRDVFGTLRADGMRQYRTVYIEVPKKNGKTLLAAGFTLKLLVADGEPAAQVYSAAAERNQAALVFRPAANMVRASTSLSRRCKIIDSQKRIIVPSTDSFYQVLSAEVPTKHGLNVHGCVIDELHAQPNRDLFDVLTTGSGDARQQPLYIFITTAGFDRNSICWEIHEKARQILNGTREDPTFYPVIYGLEESEDWEDEANWYKVNPELGNIIDIERVREHYREAKQNPAEEANFRRLRLNQWTQTVTRWLGLDKWDACNGPVGDLNGRLCYGALDLASSIDLAAFSLVFPMDDGTYSILCYCWIPEDTMHEKEKKDRVPYSNWAANGYVYPTPGNVIDYDFITQRLVELKSQFNIQEIAFDRWGATKLSQTLVDLGFKMIPFGQGFASMSAPTKEYEALIIGKKIRHGGNPVMRWNFDNLVMKHDPAGNIKPDKEKSTQKIDLQVATIMALDRAIRHADNTSVYEDRGILTI